MSALDVSRSIAIRLEEAWNASDGAAFGAVFAADADFVTVRGELHQGREAIGQGHQGIFDSIYAGSRVEYLVADARPVLEQVIVAHLSATLKVPAGPLAGVHNAFATVVMVTGDNGPEVTAFHNTQTA